MTTLEQTPTEDKQKLPLLSEKDFIKFAHDNRLRLRLDPDNTRVIRSRSFRGYGRGSVAWNRPGFAVLVAHDLSPLRNRMLARKAARICGLSYLQGSPPGEFVAEFEDRFLLKIAKTLGMVKKCSRKP